MYNWNLPHVNSLRNVWGLAIWQDTFFTLDTDRSLWSIKCSRSAAFFKIRLCENKRERSLVRILSVFSNLFVWATRRKTMERSWYLHSIYPTLSAGRYLPQSWNLSKLTMLNRKSIFKTCFDLNIPSVIQWNTNPKLILKICTHIAYIDAKVYDLLSFKASSPFVSVCTVWL